jgi:hypothetical protein
LQRHSGPGDAAALLEALAPHAPGTLIWFDAETGAMQKRSSQESESRQLGPGEQAVFESGAAAAPLYRITLRRRQAGQVAQAGT